MNDSTRFLRRSLQLDGIASGLTGVLLLFGAGPVAALIGLPLPGVARAVGALLAAGGAWAAMHGARLVVRAVRRADDASSSLWIIRGIRGLVVAVAAWALAGGLLFEQTWLLVFGGIFLAEELYETGVVALILRAAARA